MAFLRTLTASAVAALSLAAPAVADDGPAPPGTTDAEATQSAADTAVGAATDAAASASATATQSAPGNINISVRVGSPGEDGAVSQENTAAAQSGSSGEPSGSQDSGTAASSSAASQSQPTNVNVSVRVNSPGDNGPVSQQNTGSAASNAGTTPDPAPSAAGQGDQYHDGDGQYQPAQGQDAAPDQAPTASNEPGAGSDATGDDDGPAASDDDSEGAAAASDDTAASPESEEDDAGTWNWTWNWDCTTAPNWSEILVPGTTPENFTWNWTWNWDCGDPDEEPDDTPSSSGSNSPPENNSSTPSQDNQSNSSGQYQGNGQQYQTGNSTNAAQSAAAAAQNAAAVAQTAISFATPSTLTAPASPSATESATETAPERPAAPATGVGDAGDAEALAETIVSTALAGTTRLHLPGTRAGNEPPASRDEPEQKDPAAAATETATELADKIASTAVATARSAVEAATAAVPARTRLAAPDVAITESPRRQADRPHSRRAAPERSKPAAAPFWASRRQDAQTGPSLRTAATGAAAERLLRRPAPGTHERPRGESHSGGAGPGARRAQPLRSQASLGGGRLLCGVRICRRKLSHRGAHGPPGLRALSARARRPAPSDERPEETEAPLVQAGTTRLNPPSEFTSAPGPTGPVDSEIRRRHS